MQPLTCPDCLSHGLENREAWQALYDEGGESSLLAAVSSLHEGHSPDVGPFD